MFRSFGMFGVDKPVLKNKYVTTISELFGPETRWRLAFGVGKWCVYVKEKTQYLDKAG